MLNSFKKMGLKIVSILAIMLCLFIQTLYAAETPSKANQPNANQQKNKPLQNSSKAVQFFQEELIFTTNPHEVKQSIDNKETNFVIVDVRSEKDYAAGHLPGAINIPYEKHNSFHGSETAFKGLRKDAYNYVYCYELLCNLAKEAAVKFASLGYPVKEIVGGFNAWKEKDFPIENN